MTAPPYRRRRARARHTDPKTSHRAAERASSSGLGVTQQAVMIVMRVAGTPLLDEELIELYAQQSKALRLPLQSESGIRSRRSELAKMDPPRLLPGDKKRMSTGGQGLTWYVAPPLDDQEDQAA